MVYGWNKLLWKKKRDAGLISEEQYFDGLQIRDYVPGLRKQGLSGKHQGRRQRRPHRQTKSGRSFQGLQSGRHQSAGKPDDRCL